MKPQMSDLRRSMTTNDAFVYTGTFNGHRLRVRPATRQDYDDVMKIDEEVYSGLDYLPATYHETLGDPAAHSFVAELDGKVNHVLCTMPPEHLQMAISKEAEKFSVTIVTTPSLTSTIDLLCNDEVLDFLYPNGYMISADRWKVARATQHEIRRLIRNMDVNVSGSLASGDLGVSSTYAYVCSLGINIIISYAGYPDHDVIMAHVLKAAKQFASTSGLLADKQGDSSHTVVDNGYQGAEKRPVATVSIILPPEVGRARMIDLVKPIFQCEIRKDFFNVLGIYETPYKCKI